MFIMKTLRKSHQKMVGPSALMTNRNKKIWKLTVTKSSLQKEVNHHQNSKDILRRARECIPKEIHKLSEKTK